MENTKIAMVATVWRHWKPAFKKSVIPLTLSFILYNVGAYFDLMLKPVWWKNVFDALVVGGDPLLPFITVVVVIVASWCVYRCADYVIVITETVIIRNLKHYSLKGLLSKETKFFATHSLGGLVAKSKRFSSESETVIDQSVFTISRSILFVLYLIIYSHIVIPKLTGIFLLWTVVFILTTIIFSKIRMVKDLTCSEKDSATTAHLSDILSSLLTLRVFSFAQKEFTHFENTVREEEFARRTAWLTGNIQWGVQGLLTLLLEIIVMYLVIGWVTRGEETIGTAVMVQVYINSLGSYMWSLGQSLIRLRTGLADAYEMAKHLDVKENETENHFNQVVDKAPIENGITISDLSFSYEPNSPAIISDFTFTFTPGKRYGLVGYSGSGKSTLVKLILRLYEYQKGVICIGRSAITDLKKDTVRSLISYVPQNPVFPSRTVKEIMYLGKSNATMDELHQAAAKARCEFIWEKLPHGFDTHIGERGVKLSGGELQRLAIAVAILKDAPIIIMDEPTSALDAETEHSIQKSIQEHFLGKTMIVIAHRLSTVALLDEILFMNDGKILYAYPHTILLDMSEEYRRMWELQTRSEIV